MNHRHYRIVEFHIVEPYTLRIKFDDGTNQIVNFEPILYGEMLGPLRDLDVFNQVRLDSEIDNLVWPNDAAFDPETLHDWPEYVEQFAKVAKGWSVTAEAG